MTKCSYQKRGNSYRTQIRIDGKQCSITAPTVAELKQKIAEARTTSETQINASKIDFKTAMDNLLSAKSNVLSPNTIDGYNQLTRQLIPLYKKDVQKLTELEVQAFLNEYSKDHSPKSVSNLYSFMMTIIKSVRRIDWNIKLPQKKKADLPYPNEDEVRLLLNNADQKLRKGILISAFTPARRGEVCALKYKDIEGNIIHIHATIAKLNKELIYKDTPKTSSGDRYVSFPKEIIEELGTGDPEEYVVGLSPQGLYDKWNRLLHKLGLPGYRLHSTRVFGASYLHNVVKMPDAYIMKRGGWSSASVLQNIYRKNLSGDEQVLESISSFMTK